MVVCQFIIKLLILYLMRILFGGKCCEIVNQFDVGDFEFFFEDDVMWYLYFIVIKGFLDISRVKMFLDWELMIWEKVFIKFCVFFEGVMMDVKLSKEREMFLVDFFENIVFEKYYVVVVIKLVEIYGNDVLKGVELDVGFDDIFGIVGLIGDLGLVEQEMVGYQQMFIGISWIMYFLYINLDFLYINVDFLYINKVFCFILMWIRCL